MNAEPEKFRVLVSGRRTGEWWAQARSDFETEPETVPKLARPLLGKTEVRTELMSQEEAVRIRDWAESLPGWEDERGLVVQRHRGQASVDWGDL